VGGVDHHRDALGLQVRFDGLDGCTGSMAGTCTAQYVRAHPGEVCPAKWEEGEATLAPSLDLVGKI